MKQLHPWTCCGSGNSAGQEATNEASVAESQEELLQCLTKLTRLQLSEQTIPPDFRLKLQLLECAVQQQRLLQHLIDKQRRTAENLETLHGQATECYNVVQDKLVNVHRVLETVNSKLDRPIVAYTHGMTGHKSRGNGSRSPKSPKSEGDSQRPPLETVKEEAVLDVEQLLLPAAVLGMEALKPKKVSQGRHGSDSPSRNQSKGDSGAEYARNRSRSSLRSQTKEQLKEEDKEKRDFGICSELSHNHVLYKIVTSTSFDLVCALIIIFNAATIGLSTNDGIVHALGNIGSSERPPAGWLRHIGYFFIMFYLAEIAVKFFVFRLHFFWRKDWKWNVFDLSLVVVGLYDILAEIATIKGSGNVNITWIRLLRLLRMMKMLRVVRVMRFFRVLRMMMSSIAGSMVTLLWSILMLGLIMYIFGLCFLQIITGHLAETTEGSVDKQTLSAIEDYWNSVPQAIVTLYFAVTGGADWEVLAAPIREAGEYYFILFMFYIAFTAFAVLNVLTGLYVDTATKVSEMDNDAVEDELHIGLKTRAFKEYMMKQDPAAHRHHRPLVSWSKLEQNMEAVEVASFLGLADIADIEECKRVFDAADIESKGKIELDAFVHGILEHVVPSVKLELMSVVDETRRCSDQQVELVASCRQRFDEVLRRLESFDHQCQVPDLVY